MDTVHSYSIQAQWAERRSGTVTCEFVPDPVKFSAPVEFQGEPGRWTPEHFLVAAVGSCFITTFRAIAEYNQMNVLGLSVDVEGKLDKSEHGIAITEITVRPTLTLDPEADQARALKLLHKAESACFISHSLRSTVTLEPKIEILQPASA